MKKKGFTLIEVLIFTSLISFIFITLAYLAVNSINNSKIGAHKILATHHAEELREWLRSMKEENWSQFAVNSVPTCIGPTTLVGTPSSATCADVVNYCETSCSAQPTLLLGDVPDNIFWRYYTKTYNATNQQVTVEIMVVWKEGGKKFFVPLNTVFAQYE